VFNPFESQQTDGGGSKNTANKGSNWLDEL